MRRKNIVWKQGNSPEDRMRQPAYFEDRSFQYTDPSVRKFYDQYLYIGALWIIKNDIFIQSPLPKVKPHTIPYAGRMMYYSDRRIPQSTLTIYLGTTRVEERDHRGVLICPSRHTFIVEGSRIMTLELDRYFHPVEA